MSKAALSKLDTSLTTLPRDTHTDTDVLHRLFSQPKWKVREGGRKGEGGREEGRGREGGREGAREGEREREREREVVEWVGRMGRVQGEAGR